jgi:hypothetical protein
MKNPPRSNRVGAGARKSSISHNANPTPAMPIGRFRKKIARHER